MILEHNVDLPLERGSHLLAVDLTSGTVTLQISVEGTSFLTLDDTTFAVSITRYLALPKCRVRALITGTALVVLAKIEYT
jgi:hypothetical protein